MAGSKPAALPLGDTPTKSLVHGRSIQPSRDKSRPALRHTHRHLPGSRLACKCCEDARARTGEMRRCRLRKPFKRCANFRVTRTNHALAIVVTARLEKAAYCDKRGITCQFRGLEDFRRAHRHPR